jgi:glycosyltransferase involved in cell wall biosynthesis
MFSVNRKVLHVINGEHFSGAERVQDLLGQYLPKCNYEATFATLLDGKFAKLTSDRNYRVVNLKMKNRLDLRAVSSLVKLLREERFDLVHAHTVRSTLVGRLAARIVRLPLVEHIHSPMIEESLDRLKNIVNYVVEKCFDRLTSHYICVSNSLAMRLAKDGVNSTKISVVHNGIPIAPEARLERMIDERRLTRPTRETPNIGMVALLRPRKGLEVLLEAIVALSERGCKVRCTVLGPFETPNYQQLVAAKVAALGLENIVKFTGFVLDVNDHMRRFDVFALPSLFGEGLPMVILEAMALGIPVVSTEVEGVPEIFPDAKYGLVCPPGNVKEFARALEMLVMDPYRRRAIGQQGLRRQREHFSADRMAVEVSRVYDEVLNSTTH